MVTFYVFFHCYEKEYPVTSLRSVASYPFNISACDKEKTIGVIRRWCDGLAISLVDGQFSCFMTLYVRALRFVWLKIWLISLTAMACVLKPLSLPFESLSYVHVLFYLWPLTASCQGNNAPPFIFRINPGLLNQLIIINYYYYPPLQQVSKNT